MAMPQHRRWQRTDIFFNRQSQIGNPPLFFLNTLKKPIMQVTVCKSLTFAAKVLRYFQWNRATAIRCRGWSRGAHAPSRAAVDASSTAPTRAFARGSRLAGNPQFWDSPGQSSSRRLPSLRLASRASARRFPNLRAVSFQPRLRTCLRPSFRRVFRDSFPNGCEISGLAVCKSFIL